MLKKQAFVLIDSQKIFSQCLKKRPCVTTKFPMFFPCLEKVRTKFPMEHYIFVLTIDMRNVKWILNQTFIAEIKPTEGSVIFIFFFVKKMTRTFELLKLVAENKCMRLSILKHLFSELIE